MGHAHARDMQTLGCKVLVRSVRNWLRLPLHFPCFLSDNAKVTHGGGAGLHGLTAGAEPDSNHRSRKAICLFGIIPIDLRDLDGKMRLGGQMRPAVRIPFAPARSLLRKAPSGSSCGPGDIRLRSCCQGLDPIADIPRTSPNHHRGRTPRNYRAWVTARAYSGPSPGLRISGSG